MNASLNGLTLHVEDVERSLEFYARIPGAVVAHHRPGQFALLRIGAGRLGLLKLGRGTFHMELGTADLDAMYAALQEAGLQPESPPVQRPWGERDFLLIDPDGNTIEFDAERE
jgi:catechol 2,3-dioxygenase-like lactoylglutathione lyase family enzyme